MAAGLDPELYMNSVLLKLEVDTRSQVVVRSQALYELAAMA